MNGLEDPGSLDAGIRRVGAEGSGPDRGLEMLAERRALLGQPVDRRPDGACHVYPGPLGGRRGSPVPAAEPDRTRQLSDESLALLLGSSGTLLVAPLASFLDLCLD